MSNSIYVYIKLSEVISCVLSVVCGAICIDCKNGHLNMHNSLMFALDILLPPSIVID